MAIGVDPLWPDDFFVLGFVPYHVRSLRPGCEPVKLAGMNQSIDPGASRAILEAVQSLEEQAVSSLGSLVRHRSVLGQEQTCLEEATRIYREIGLEPYPVPVEASLLADHPGFSPPLIPYEARDNIVAVHRPRQAKGRSLLLQGHVDVVPEGAADLWTTPPYEPSIRNGRMYGRGAGDMKAGIICFLVAFAALRRAGLQPAAEVQFAAVIEEESTGNGALAVMRALPKPDACLIPEPGDGHSALYIAEVGVVWAWVTITGRPVHVREMHKGVNAIEAAYIVIERFKAYETEMNKPERRHPAFAAIDHPINVNLGTIQGGEWNSSVPTRARLGMRVGVMPGHSCHDVRAEIEHLIQETAQDRRLESVRVEVEFRGFMADGAIFAPEQEISLTVSALHRQVAGEDLRPYAATGLTDARLYKLYQNTEATCYGPSAENIHGIDENVDLASMQTVICVLALTMAAWCGLEAVAA